MCVQACGYQTRLVRRAIRRGRLAETLINQRRDQEKQGSHVEQKDLLQCFLEARTPEGLPIPHREVLSEVLGLLGAGAETTAIGIRAVLGPLLLNKEAYKKLVDEIDDYCRINSSTDRDLTYTECAQLPYLQAVIKEGMRLHPSIQFQLPRSVAQGGAMVCGHFIPENVEISMSPRSMNRDAQVFGADAHLWRPERWLEDKTRAAEMDRSLSTVSRLWCFF